MADVSWTELGGPEDVTLSSAAGACWDVPGKGLREATLFYLSKNGELRQAQFLFPAGASSWSSHGLPATGVKCAAPVGALRVHMQRPPGLPQQKATWVFATGSDGHLWARSADPDTDPGNWAWADHGAPAGRAVVSGIGPHFHFTQANEVHMEVPVLADNGRLWVRTGGTAGPGPGPDWTWTERGVPPGELIFSLIGAFDAAPTVPVVTTSLGNVWLSAPDGTGFSWANLGAPPGETIAAGIGLGRPDAAPGSVEIAGLGVPSGQVWTIRWRQGTVISSWTPRGGPPGGPIHDALGVVRDPAKGTRIMVLGSDQQVWVTSTASPAPDWTRLDPPANSQTTSVASGHAEVLVNLGINPATFPPDFAVLVNQAKRAALIALPLPSPFAHSGAPGSGAA